MNSSYNYDPMTGAPLRPNLAGKAKQNRMFSAKERVLAWIAVLIGYFFCRTFWIWEKPAVGLAFALCLFTFGFVFFGKLKRKARSWFYPVSALALSCALFFSASPVLLFFTFAYICLAFILFCQTGAETALEGRAGQLYVFETVKALFFSPFKSIGALIGAIAANGKGEKKLGKTLLTALIGVGLAFVPTVIVLILLSFDRNFIDILKTIWQNVFTHVLSILFGIPIGMYLYAALYSAAHPAPDTFNAESCIRAEDQMKFAPALIGAVAIAPLLFLYGVFITAQRDYYKAIFTATLPDAFTFADFARDGFFRLCAVAAINALALIALRVFTQKTNGGKISPVVKTYSVILSLLTIVISGTAISQMIMYTATYGLTRLRLYTLWFMVLLILLFLAAILKQFIVKLPFAATALTVFVLCFGLLAVPDTDGIIARHNYRCHLAGTTYELDAAYLGELLPSSLPVLCEIEENGALSDEVRTAALAEIGKYAAQEKHPFNLPGLRAEKAFRALDSKTKLRAAVAYDALCPPVYLSEQEKTFYTDDGYFGLRIFTYDKSMQTVFTDNARYTPFQRGKQSAKADELVEKYTAACKSAGKKNLLPFAEKDLTEKDRFYYALTESNSYEDPFDTVLYLFDSSSGSLTVLQFG